MRYIMGFLTRVRALGMGLFPKFWFKIKTSGLLFFVLNIFIICLKVFSYMFFLLYDKLTNVINLS